MLIQQPCSFFNLSSSCSSRPKQRRSCRMLLPPVAGCAAAEASPPLLFPPLAKPCGDGSLTPQRTSEPSYSSMRGHPLLRLPRLRVVPFLGLAIVHRRGALGAAWSMWSTTDFHRKSTVHGEADSWVDRSHKEVPPYYAQNNYSST